MKQENTMNTIRRYAPLAIVILAAAGCGASASTSAPPSSHPAAAVVRSSSPPSCAAQVITWRDSGGSAQLTAVATDLTSIRSAGGALGAALAANADMSGPESALQSAAASLQSDAQAAEANLPPACVPGLRGAYGQALTDYSKASGDYQNAVSEMGSNSSAVALGDLEAGNAAATAGTGKLQTAAADMSAFNNG
jgi:hypothetical protein